jgi:O-antigen/teichoic acid export membrane protein
MRDFIASSQWIKGFTALLGGTVVAQAIPIFFSPILTRIFSPEEMGVLAFYISLIAILSVLATGRFELAIQIPRSDKEAFKVMLLASSLSVTGSAVVLICTLLLTSLFSSSSIADKLGGMIWMIPLSLMMAGIFQSTSYWLNRKQAFFLLSKVRILQSLILVFLQILLGYLGFGEDGLIFGYFIGQLSAILFLIRSGFPNISNGISKKLILNCIAVARRHKNFPRYMIPGQLANIISSQTPVILLGIIYGPSYAGFYALTERVLLSPSSIIGTAVGDIYRQRAALAYQATGNCRVLFLKTLLLLTLTSCIPLLVILIAGPWIFATIFGAYWHESGEIAQLMAFMFFFQMISSPLSQTVLFAQMQSHDMVWQFARLILAICSMLIGSIIWNDYRASLGLYATAFSILYVIHSLMQYRAACGNKNAGKEDAQ